MAAKVPDINPSTPRSEARGIYSGLILSGAFYPYLKIGFGAVERIKTPLPEKRARKVDAAVAIFADVLGNVQKEGRST